MKPRKGGIVELKPKEQNAACVVHEAVSPLHFIQVPGVR